MDYTAYFVWSPAAASQNISKLCMFLLGNNKERAAMLLFLIKPRGFCIDRDSLAVSGDGRACPPGQEWKQCVVGAVSCSDLTMDLSRNCTPGCQCPRGTVQQVGGLLQPKHNDACKHIYDVSMMRHVADDFRMARVCGSPSAAVT